MNQTEITLIVSVIDLTIAPDDEINATENPLAPQHANE